MNNPENLYFPQGIRQPGTIYKAKITTRFPEKGNRVGDTVFQISFHSEWNTDNALAVKIYINCIAARLNGNMGERELTVVIVPGRPQAMPVFGFLTKKTGDDFGFAVPDDVHDVNVLLVKIEIHACLKHKRNGLAQCKGRSVVSVAD